VAVITTSAASSSVHLQRHTTDIRLGMTLELANLFRRSGYRVSGGLLQPKALEGLFAGSFLYSSITILRVAQNKERGSAAVDNNGQTVIPPYEPHAIRSGVRLAGGRWTLGLSALAASYQSSRDFLL